MTDQYDIFNPKPLTPEEVAEERAAFSSAKEWVEHIEFNHPYLDPKEEYKIKVAENRKENQAKCGQVRRGGYCPIKLRFLTTVWYCKQKECPKCQERKKWQLEKRFDNLDFNPSIVTVAAEDAKAFAASLSKSEYIRIPRESGEVSFILEGEYENSQPLDYNLKQELLQASVDLPGNQRVTGNLGKETKAMPQQSELNAEDTIAEAEQLLEDELSKESIKVQQIEIAYKSDSKLKSDQQIETEVLKRLDASEIEYNINALQWLIKQLQDLTAKVCRDNGVQYKVLYIETISVQPDEIEWDDFENRLEQAKKE